MIILQGTGVVGGVVFGKLRFLGNGAQEVTRQHIDDPGAEITRYESANVAATAQLGELRKKALDNVGEQGAALFEIHQMMLEDADYCDSIRNIILRQEVNAEYAVAITGDNFSQMFSQMDDAYMQARAADVNDISERLIKVLSGRESDDINFSEPVILAADDLAPSETVKLDKDKILAFITAKGSANSHTAILARTMGIPAIIQVEGLLDCRSSTDFTIVDGGTGMVYIDPDAETLALMREKQEKEMSKLALLERLKGKPNITKDGKAIMVYANIGSLSDLGAVLKNDAGGIGLFRTEFLYLESKDYPTEEEQFRAYKTVVETMSGKRVIFRTLDIGADKQVEYFALPKEENPALGMRAIRICLTRPELFKTQLRALYRASAFGNAAIMFPMIASVWEIRQAKQIADEVCRELADSGVPFAEDVELGIMIETPAAAVISDLLAEEVNFFSIGTNDLIQYTLAADRQNQSIGEFRDTHHEAVLRLIRRTVENAHAANIWAGICGELGADLSLTEYFIGMGIDELSVSPAAVLPLRDKIMQTDSRLLGNSEGGNYESV
jgi:phosphotransferase system enzyme I (PtsI)